MRCYWRGAVPADKVTFSVDRNFTLVTAPTIERVAVDSCLEHVRKLPAPELEALIYCILRHFVRWSRGEIQQLPSCVALISNLCFVRSVPLFEAACLLYAIRDCLSDIDRMERLRSGSDLQSDDAPGECALFFDLIVFELLKGY